MTVVHDLLKTPDLDRISSASRFDGFHQQPLDTLFSNSLALARRRRGINRRSMLKIDFTTEVLPLWVLRLDLHPIWQIYVAGTAGQHSSTAKWMGVQCSKEKIPPSGS